MNKTKVYSPKEVDVKKMFNDIAPHYDFLNHFLSAGIDKRWRKKAIKLLSSYNPKQILDIATGTGDLAVDASVIQFQQAASENLPFIDSSFDAVTVAFGVRNFKDLEKGLNEISRVLKKDGVAIILEFSIPVSFPMKQLYLFYFRNILPLIGRIVSKSKAAYTYLPETVMKFPQGEVFTALLEKNGFRKTEFVKLSGGICTIYIAEK